MGLASHSPVTLGGPSGLCPSPFRDGADAPSGPGVGAVGVQTTRPRVALPYRISSELSHKRYLVASWPFSKLGQESSRKSPVEMSVVLSHEA